MEGKGYAIRDNDSAVHVSINWKHATKLESFKSYHSFYFKDIVVRLVHLSKISYVKRLRIPKNVFHAVDDNFKFMFRRTSSTAFHVLLQIPVCVWTMARASRPIWIIIRGHSHMTSAKLLDFVVTSLSVSYHRLKSADFVVLIYYFGDLLASPSADVTCACPLSGASRRVCEPRVRRAMTKQMRAS